MRLAMVSCNRDDAATPEALLEKRENGVRLAAAIARSGVAVDVVQAHGRAGMIERDGVRFHFVADRVMRRAPHVDLHVRRLVRMVRVLRPDLIHVHGLGFPVQTRHLCGLKIPVVVQDHGGHMRPVLKPLYRWGLARVEAAFFTGTEQAKPLLASGILPSRAAVFSLPESSSAFHPGDRLDARLQTGTHGDPMLLWVGRLNDNKDPLTALAAFERVLPRLGGARLWCCFHEAPLLERVRAWLADRPHVAAHVRLLGRQSRTRIELLCRAADIFLLSSHKEVAGFALMEAMACGASPVVSDIPAFRAQTGNGAIGALATAGDAASFAAAILRVAARPQEEARATVLAHFARHLSFDAVGARMAAAYRAILDAAP